MGNFRNLTDSSVVEDRPSMKNVNKEIDENVDLGSKKGGGDSVGGVRAKGMAVEKIEKGNGHHTLM